MAGIRTLEMGYPKTARTYATQRACEKAVRKYTDRIQGICNVLIVPASYDEMNPGPEPLRYTAILSCFSEEGDTFLLARAGCPFMTFR